ncbi:hypothetical protein OG763_38370 [Streptomyces sp. NBC_01230]|uniref:hypothetical protein n=1 Tax=Streptomyces sp. NBC_01230 TaxID=2903784 RepID=UPI002E152ACE|nr:hypothetical protein OG763_38370 [Streptomyces sp. NBC_01230]
MIPSNVVRCLADNGPILYPPTGGRYKCETCGGGLKPGQSPEPALYWGESYGYLCLFEVEEDERDTEEEISDLYSAIGTFASILGDPMTASGVGGHFTCSEANDLVRALMVGDHKHAAMTFLEGHAHGDYDVDDEHGDLLDYEAYVLELAGQPVPELIEEPEPKAAEPKADEFVIVTTEELIALIGL